ncbi:MAG: glycosyltransferase [Fimbriimonadales bacterium]
MVAEDNRKVVYVLGGTQGEERKCENVAYYHRADRLREAVERRGFESEVIYSRRSGGDNSVVMRMLRSGWVRYKFSDHRAVYAASHDDAVRYKNGATPTKLPESLALGRPILSGDAYDTAGLIRQLSVGWVVGNTADGVAEGMNRLAGTPSAEIAEMGRRARSEAERHYGWGTVGQIFAEALAEATKF